MQLLAKCLPKNTKKNMAKLVDANLIIRFLLNDNPSQAEATEKLFASSKDLILTDLTLAEVVWTLQSVYRFSKQEITQKVKHILSLEIFDANYNLLNNSLEFYQGYNISFADAYLLAYIQEKNLEGIYSFDRGLDKVKTIKRFKP